MNQLIEAVKAYFQEKKWYWQQIDEDTLRGSMCGDNGRWEWFAHGEREDALLYFFSVCPVSVPRDRRHAVAEYLTRANYGMPLGCFEMDYADDEVRCRTSLPLEAGQVPSQGRLEEIILANFRTLDRYLPGLLAVICGKTTPRRAIQSIESPRRQAEEEADEDQAPGSSPHPPPDQRELKGGNPLFVFRTMTGGCQWTAVASMSMVGSGSGEFWPAAVGGSGGGRYAPRRRHEPRHQPAYRFLGSLAPRPINNVRSLW